MITLMLVGLFGPIILFVTVTTIFNLFSGDYSHRQNIENKSASQSSDGGYSYSSDSSDSCGSDGGGSCD